jgi:hypothetical protein
MAVRRVPRDEDAPDLIVLGHGDAQVPEPDVLELARKREPGSLFHQRAKIEAVFRRAGRRRRVEEKSFADVDAAEKLPIAFQFRPHDAIRGALREPLERFMELAGTEHHEHHGLIEIVPPRSIPTWLRTSERPPSQPTR